MATNFLEAEGIPGKNQLIRVLVAEDNSINRLIVKSLLAKLVHFDTTLHIVEDGQQALDFITQGGRPDVVLMDVQMPVMDGLTATQKIRAWETSLNQTRVPIIALTADTHEAARQNCLAAGMDDFLIKPLIILKLEAMMRRLFATEGELHGA